MLDESCFFLCWKPNILDPCLITPGSVIEVDIVFKLNTINGCCFSVLSSPLNSFGQENKIIMLASVQAKIIQGLNK